MIEVPFKSLYQWRRLLVRGTPVVIESFLESADNLAGRDWTRDPSSEATSSRPDRVRCFRTDRPDGAAIRVWMTRVTESRIRGGAVQIDRHVPGRQNVPAELVEEFEAGIVVPASRHAGTTLTAPGFGNRSTVPSTVIWALNELADRCDGARPATDSTIRSWHEAVIVAQRERAVLDPDEFRSWMVDSGWSVDDATDLAARFYADAELIAAYEDRRQAA